MRQTGTAVVLPEDRIKGKSVELQTCCNIDNSRFMLLSQQESALECRLEAAQSARYLSTLSVGLG